MSKKTIIIAEAGVNHGGSLDMARRLIDEAAKAGADIVKFQTFRADDLILKDVDKADYQKKCTDPSESQYDMLKKLELDREAHLGLIRHCKDMGIEFLSTPFDHKSIDMLAEFKRELFKIPSGEITNLPYLRHIGRVAKDIILSTGMANLGEIECALEVLQQVGTSKERITILHCNSEYPTPMEDVNLKAMLTIQNAFGVKVGYSDHTLGIEVPIAAVALGATIIEKHFTLDQTLPGPDHRISLEPEQLKAMVKAIRNIELALGVGMKCASPSELKNRSIVRKSIVALRDIQKGELMTEENVTVKRPGTGISPMRWDELMGYIAPRDFKANEMIEL